MDYRVELPSFHGPLDLLLYLVRKNEVDILDIPIASIASQFQQHLAIMQVADIELAGDFLVMAAMLMEIKSRMLFPNSPSGEDRDDELVDPRKELVKQLLEYKKYKEAAAQLESRGLEQQRRLPRVTVDVSSGTDQPPQVQAVELWDLVSAFGRLLSETKALEPSQIVADETPQHVYQDMISEQLRLHSRVRFRDLFTPPHHRARLVGLFLAVLELIRGWKAELDQDGLFGEIWVRRVAETAKN